MKFYFLGSTESNMFPDFDKNTQRYCRRLLPGNCQVSYVETIFRIHLDSNIFSIVLRAGYIYGYQRHTVFIARLKQRLAVIHNSLVVFAFCFFCCCFTGDGLQQGMNLSHLLLQIHLVKEFPMGSHKIDIFSQFTDSFKRFRLIYF